MLEHMHGTVSADKYLIVSRPIMCQAKWQVTQHKMFCMLGNLFQEGDTTMIHHMVESVKNGAKYILIMANYTELYVLLCHSKYVLGLPVNIFMVLLFKKVKTIDIYKTATLLSSITPHLLALCTCHYWL